MYRSVGPLFGFEIEPGPSEPNHQKPVTIQILRRIAPGSDETECLGRKIRAEDLESLIQQLQKAKQLLRSEFVAAPEGYRKRNAFF